MKCPVCNGLGAKNFQWVYNPIELPNRLRNPSIDHDSPEYTDLKIKRAAWTPQVPQGHEIVKSEVFTMMIGDVVRRYIAVVKIWDGTYKLKKEPFCSTRCVEAFARHAFDRGHRMMIT